MKDLDERILEALNQEDRQLLDQYREKNLFFQWTGSFRGQWMPYMILTASASIGAAVLAGFCVYWYFNATDQETKNLASTGFITAMMGTAVAKFMHYAHVGNANVIREIKRLELQISLLVENISSEK